MQGEGSFAPANYFPRLSSEKSFRVAIGNLGSSGFDGFARTPDQARPPFLDLAKQGRRFWYPRDCYLGTLLLGELLCGSNAKVAGLDSIPSMRKTLEVLKRTKMRNCPVHQRVYSSWVPIYAARRKVTRLPGGRAWCTPLAITTPDVTFAVNLRTGEIRALQLYIACNAVALTHTHTTHTHTRTSTT